MGQSGFGLRIIFFWVGPNNPPIIKSCTAIINGLACFNYLPCSVRPLFLHFSVKWKKHVPNIL